jgi:hypothetical protein
MPITTKFNGSMRVCFFSAMFLAVVGLAFAIKLSFWHVNLGCVAIPEGKLAVCLFSKTNLPDSLTWSLNLEVSREETTHESLGQSWTIQKQISSLIDYPTDYKLGEATLSNDVLHVGLLRHGRAQICRFRLIWEDNGPNLPRKVMLEQLDVIQ